MLKLLNNTNKIDSYKSSHFLLYPPDAGNISSYVEPRLGAEYDEIVFFGPQAWLKENLMIPVTKAEVEATNHMLTAHGLPFNYDGWMIIVNEFGGYVPLSVYALPEGTVHAPGVPQVQVWANDDRFAWLGSIVETNLLRGIWYPTSVSSLSRRAKQFIYQGLVKTADDPDAEIGFKLHDFGARGATCSEAAMLGGMGHLVNFLGTDTVEALFGAVGYYNADGPVGFSIPASEHSTVTSWGREGEADMFGNMLKQFPSGMFAMVIDSYDTFNFVKNIAGDQYKEQIMSREGTVVLRPDSGLPTAMPLDVIECAMDKFGFTLNSKGFRVLPDQVRIIQGDGMNLDSIRQLTQNAIDRGISTSNFAMGMGGGLLQNVTRDTNRYAMKANAIQRDGGWEDVYKQPKTDPTKASKRGRQAVVMDQNGLRASRIEEIPTGAHGAVKNYLREIYRNGELLVDDNFDAIRERAAI